MGLRDKLKGKVKEVVGRLSGERSAGEANMGEFKEFDRNIGEDEDREVVMARLNRPKTTK